MSKYRKVLSYQGSDFFINLVKASKVLDIDLNELIRFGAFESLPIYIYACYEESFFPFAETIQDSNSRLYLDGYFQIEEQDLKKMFASHKADSKIRVLTSESGEKFMAAWGEFVTVENFSMLYLNKIDLDNLNIGSTIIEDVVTESLSLGRRDVQLELILAVIKALNYNPLEIPNGGKSKIKKICLERNRIFTDAGFNHAWKKGLMDGLFRLENHGKYSSKI